MGDAWPSSSESSCARASLGAASAKTSRSVERDAPRTAGRNARRPRRRRPETRGALAIRPVIAMDARAFVVVHFAVSSASRGAKVEDNLNSTRARLNSTLGARTHVRRSRRGPRVISPDPRQVSGSPSIRPFALFARILGRPEVTRDARCARAVPARCAGERPLPDRQLIPRRRSLAHHHRDRSSHRLSRKEVTFLSPVLYALTWRSQIDK